MNIFISYSSKDRLQVEALAADLRRLGHVVWFDQELSRAGGHAWWALVLQRIRECDVFVFALTQRALVSIPCQREYKYAFALDKLVLPILIGELNVAVLPAELQTLQIIPYRERSIEEGLALSASLSDLPAAHVLPDPLPPEPDIPLPAEAQIRASLDAERLNLEEQRMLYFELEALYRDPERRNNAIDLLLQFQKRPDLVLIVSGWITDLLKGHKRKGPLEKILDLILNRRALAFVPAFVVLILVVGLLLSRSGLFSPVSQSEQSPTNVVSFLPTITNSDSIPTSVPDTDTAVAIIPTSGALPQNKVIVTWFVGLGTGGRAEQLDAQKKVVEEFNASQDKITLVLQTSDNVDDAVATLTPRLASDQAPDIAGPVGLNGFNTLGDQWMDLTPLIEKNNTDLSKFDPLLLDAFKTPNGSYSALPFAVYPSVIYFNETLFDQAGLKYPPMKFDDKYTMPDGSQVNWNYETISQIAKRLTLDKNGNDARSDKFDSRNIVQYGLNFQWARMRLILTDIQPSEFYNAATNTIKISDEWKTATQWIWNGLWKDHFLSSTTAETSTAFQPTAFASGHIAMAITPLWYTCCMMDTVGKLQWNIGVVPQSLDGKYHVATDTDGFRIFKGTKHPDEAFTVLQYLVNQAVPELSPVYGNFPALSSEQQNWINTQNEIYTHGVNWQVAIDSLKYANPGELNHESSLPSFVQVQDRFIAFQDLLFGDTGKDIDINKELNILQSDLQNIVNSRK